MFLSAPLRSGTSGIFDTALDEAPIAPLDTRLVASKLQEAGLTDAASLLQMQQQQPVTWRAYPSTPYYGILSSLAMDMPRRLGQPQAMADPHAVHRRLQECVRRSGSLYVCSTSPSGLLSVPTSHAAGGGGSAKAPSSTASPFIQQQQCPLLQSKYVDAFCNAFEQLEASAAALGQTSPASAAAVAAEDGAWCSDVLCWTLERHEVYRDARCLFFVEDRRLCCFVHTTSRALRLHLGKWHSRVTSGAALAWIDGGVFLQDAAMQGGAVPKTNTTATAAETTPGKEAPKKKKSASGGGSSPPSASPPTPSAGRRRLSTVRAMFDLLLNLRLHSSSAAYDLKGTPMLSGASGNEPSGSGGGGGGGGLGFVSLAASSAASAAALSAGMAIAQARQALLLGTAYLPPGLHVSLAASYPFVYAEHRAPTLRAVRRVSRMAAPPLSKQQPPATRTGDGSAMGVSAAEEEVFSWTLAALPGYYLLPTALGAIVRCLRDECKVDAFTLRLEAETSGGRWLPSSVAAGRDGTAAAGLQRNASTGAAAYSAAQSTGMRILARPAGATAAANVSQVSVPLLCFSRLSSEGWLDPSVRALYAATPAAQAPHSNGDGAASDDDGADGDLEFYPAAIHFRRAELLVPARSGMKRSRSGSSRRSTSQQQQQQMEEAEGRKEFAVTPVVVYAPVGPEAEAGDVAPLEAA